MRDELSPNMLATLRALHERGENIAGSDRTRTALRRRGLAEGQGTDFRITDAGRRFITAYVERTGDGPEHLKARFRMIGL